MKPKRIAIVGAGPIGLEAALEARDRGFDAAVYEAGGVGEHLRRFGHVTLFTPFRMNSTDLGRHGLEAAGVRIPPPKALLTAAELVDRYLEPLARLPELRDSIREHAVVTHVGREGISKGQGLASPEGSPRAGLPFLLRVEPRGESARFERADFVIDATGVYGTPGATGPGGLPALGEEECRDRIDRHIPSILAADRGRYRGKRVLLVGGGHSAATALVELERLAREEGDGAIQVHWVHRDRGGAHVFTERPDDPLAARRDLAARSNAAARSASWLTRHPGATIRSYSRVSRGSIRVALAWRTGEERAIEVDQVLALVGYRPDAALHRELQVHLCYASEGTMALAAAILARSLASPQAAGDCLAQISHGAETLRNPEPGFFILGAKSYGRNPDFLLTIGHEQVRDALSLMAAEASFRSAVPSTSP